MYNALYFFLQDDTNCLPLHAMMHFECPVTDFPGNHAAACAFAFES